MSLEFPNCTVRLDPEYVVFCTAFNYVNDECHAQTHFVGQRKAPLPGTLLLWRPLSSKGVQEYRDLTCIFGLYMNFIEIRHLNNF